MAESEPTLRLRWVNLGAAFLVVGTISAVALQWWLSRGGAIPALSPLLAALLAIIAAVVLVLGLRVRRWVARGEHVDPLGATRTLVLGQAAALGGAVLGGYLTASLVLALTRWGAPEPRSVAVSSGAALIAAILMSAAGMVTQWCCRVPPRDQDGDPPAVG